MDHNISTALRRHNVTPRELQTIEHLLKGLSNEEIAQAMGVKVQTVKHQITMVNAKVGTRSRHKLIVWCNNQISDQQRLIDNAPDMLIALENCLLTWSPIQGKYRDHMVWMNQVEQLRNLIKKVKGA